ncbi:hypothetical protein JTE90_013996 [Oedothorax gibbosus]|uniref:Uncharacterized protein n=1 Tax=Oedothorax gibbosus TaxID=931172 RepID=A0AAV6TWR8_9ARAC|nr:hypothetical protein JTE90_013996 [Oedothorax gibbosus]
MRPMLRTHTANFRLCPKRPLTAPQRDQRPEQVTPSAAQQPPPAPLTTQQTPPPPSVTQQTFTPPTSVNPPAPPLRNVWNRPARHPTTNTPGQTPQLQNNPPSSDQACNTSTQSTSTFDIKHLFTMLKTYWQRFKQAKDMMSKLEIGFEAVQEFITLISYE